MDEHENLSRLEFSLDEFKAIVAILQGNIRYSLRSMSQLPTKKRMKEKDRILRVDKIKRRLNEQILNKNVHLILSTNEIKDIVQVIKTYRYYVSVMFPSNRERDEVLATAYIWQQRFQSVLSKIQPET